MAKVLVLGATGMLGHSVAKVFKNDPSIHLIQTSREKREGYLKFEAMKDDVTELIKDVKPDWVINCIGVIKPHIDEKSPESIIRAVEINGIFPYLLAKCTSKSIIQIATDCVFSGTKGNYIETDFHDPVDIYGKSKSVGEVPSGNLMNLRASIIGPEVGRSTSLFEWVRNQPQNAQITGYTDHHWNGVTAASFAKICKGIVESQGFIAGVQHLIPGDTVTKSQLVKEIAAKTNRLDIEIIDGPSGTETDRTLATANAGQNLKLWTNAGYKTIPNIFDLVDEIEL